MLGEDPSLIVKMAASLDEGSSSDITVGQRLLMRHRLKACLEKQSGSKDLCLDPSLIKVLDRIAGTKFLKEHGVNKIFMLENGKGLQGITQRTYIVRPDLVKVKFICDQINSEKQINQAKDYFIAFVPRKLHTCDYILEQEGVAGLCKTSELVLDLVPVDVDILSMSMPNIFIDTFLHGDQGWLVSIARSIVGLEHVIGKIPNSYGQGRFAQLVNKLRQTLHTVEGNTSYPSSTGIGHLFLIDRDVDFLTPLCQQVTYEALIDEVFSIECGVVEFGPEVSGKAGKTKVMLSANDQVYDEIRNKHISHVSEDLRSKLQQLQTGYDKRHTLQSIGDLKEFVGKELGGLKDQHRSLGLHVGACEWILKTKLKGDFQEQLRTEHSLLEGGESKECLVYIEEIINRQVRWQVPLKLLCVHSLVHDGMSAKDYNFFRTIFLQSYGYERLCLWDSLERLGLLTQQGNSSPAHSLAALSLTRKSGFRTLCKRLALIPKSEDVQLQQPRDMSYVFSGVYVPLSCRLIETVVTKESWAGLEDISKHLAGTNFADVTATSLHTTQKDSRRPRAPKVVLVYFIGGCTYAEIAALRFLGKVRGYNFIIATTSILNTQRLLSSISDAV